MGDRALVIFKTEDEISPAAYLHWSGNAVPEILEQHKTLMKTRTGDASYACARFIGICHNRIDGNLSLGVFSIKPEELKAVQEGNADEIAEFSHGDAGVIVVDCSTEAFEWKAYGGYLAEKHAA
jgi:hypothetical protein